MTNRLELRVAKEAPESVSYDRIPRLEFCTDCPNICRTSTSRSLWQSQARIGGRK